MYFHVFVIYLKAQFIELTSTATEPGAIIVIDLSPANMVMRSVASGIPEKTDFKKPSRKTPSTGICG